MGELPTPPPLPHDIEAQLPRRGTGRSEGGGGCLHSHAEDIVGLAWVESPSCQAIHLQAQATHQSKGAAHYPQSRPFPLCAKLTCLLTFRN